jgi:hypothetical protein
MAILLASNVGGTLNVTGQILEANGTVTAPAYTFGAQTNAGLFLITTNAIGITSNGNIIFNIAQTSVVVNTTTFTHNGAVNIAGSLNVTANIANTGNLLVTQNTFTGNLSVTKNITCANITVNSISFIPVWTNATLNASYAALTNYNPPSFWKDPFGIVHIRGVLKPAANLSFSSALNVNIANGLPTPANASLFIAPAANDTILGTNTSAYVTWNVCANGAMQIIADFPIATGNLVYASLDGFIYGTVGG